MLLSTFHWLDRFLNCWHSLVDQLTTYLTNLRPWMMEVTEALDKLGEAPASATELEFNMD